MKKFKDDQTEKSKKVEQENNIPSKLKIGSAGKKPIVFPEEFEEDRSMNIRMKPQPLAQSAKKTSAKNNIKKSDKS